MKTKQEYKDFITLLAEGAEERLASDSFQSTITFHVDIDQPRLIFFPQPDGTEERYNLISWGLSVLAAGMDNLWALAFAMDSYHVTSPTKKDGTPWGMGGMQYAIENQTEDADLVYEALYYTVVEVGGEAGGASLPYKRTPEGVEFLWDKLEVMIEGEGGAKLQGFFPNAMRHALKAPKIVTELISMGVDADALGLSPERARLHAMCIAAKMVMMRLQTPVLIPCYSDEEQEVVKQSMTEGPFSEHFRMYDQDDVEEIHSLEQSWAASEEQQ